MLILMACDRSNLSKRSSTAVFRRRLLITIINMINVDRNHAGASDVFWRIRLFVFHSLA
jgi:hypothetical protein